MKFINNINKYYKNSRLINNSILFIKLNNGIEYNTIKYWYKNGLRHRENDKPAVEFSDGGKAWYINGKFIKQNYDKKGDK